MTHDIGLIGLAVMGQNLALNCRDKGFSIAVYNRSFSKTEAFLQHHSNDSSTALNGFESLSDFVQALAKPRKIILMVKAGAAVDQTIAQLIPLLDAGDIIIDGGNSDFQDSENRAKLCQSHELLFVGSGISGGEEGARFGPSIMPGGDSKAWPAIKNIFQTIAAQVEQESCCEWMGAGGAGHFVKMVHNGIEYGDMQLITESYALLKSVLQLDNASLADCYSRFNQGPLNSYLIEITAEIFAFKDSEGNAVIDYILDTAGQKGTGRWTAINAMEHGTPLTIIAEAVYARSLSARLDDRLQASSVLPKNNATASKPEHDTFLSQVENALLLAKILSYAQGFMLLRDASNYYAWDLNLANIAKIWRGGCIIRSQFLNPIREAYSDNPTLENLLFADYFKQAIASYETDLRNVIILAIQHGIAVPALSAALSFLDGLRESHSTANLLQAQRDYFGAHTYERRDQARGQYFHTDWAGLNGSATSGTYDA
ncbi:MAG: decarboxylating NADP(+)-dependent phosphogluconate dehydrogenase [Pseudomonadales bacterium]|nr:decarboxylating NADP(+)-dependent phosphogluconate dehydrogenase [Pseudomonadales bacterium]